MLSIQHDDLRHSKIPSKILAHSTELETKVQKFWQKDGFFVDKKETSDHLLSFKAVSNKNIAFR